MSLLTPPGVQSIIAVVQTQGWQNSYGGDTLVALQSSDGLSLSYPAALKAAWSVTWRLLLANLVLVLLIVALTTVLIPALNRSGSASINMLYAGMEWLLAWPFVARVALAPQVLSPDLYPPSAFNPKRERSPIRYLPAVMFGVVIDLLSGFPVFALAFALHSLATVPFLIVLSLLLRLFVILPFGVQLLSRRLAASVIL